MEQWVQEGSIAFEYAREVISDLMECQSGNHHQEKINRIPTKQVQNGALAGCSMYGPR